MLSVFLSRDVALCPLGFLDPVSTICLQGTQAWGDTDMSASAGQDPRCCQVREKEDVWLLVTPRDIVAPPVGLTCVYRSTRVDVFSSSKLATLGWLNFRVKKHAWMYVSCCKHANATICCMFTHLQDTWDTQMCDQTIRRYGYMFFFPDVLLIALFPAHKHPPHRPRCPPPPSPPFATNDDPQT